MKRSDRFEGDSAVLEDGEDGWTGVDERPHPSKVQPGMVCSAKNARFRNGEIETRPGIALASWGLGVGRTPFGVMRGAGLYEGADGTEWLIVAAGSKVYATRPGMVAQELSLPDGFSISGKVRMVQAFDKIILGRGFDEAPLELRVLADGFREITQESSEAGNGTGTLVIPNHTYAEFMQDRLVIVGDGDIGYIGDIGNHTRYLKQNAFRINTGSFDDLVRVRRLGTTAALAFKRESVHLVDNLVPDANGDWSGARQSVVTDAHGLAADDALVAVGSDIYYLSERGVSSIRLTDEGNFRGVDLPLSDFMRKTWRRVNKDFLRGAQMSYWDSKLYVALPLDRAEILGDDLVPSGSVYGYAGGGGLYNHRSTGEIMAYKVVTGLTEGATYRFDPGSGSDFAVENGSEFQYGPQYIVAQGTSVYLYGENGSAVGATFREVEHQGVNTAVAVYDFVNQAWSGLDEAEGVTEVYQFVKFHWQGRQHLGYFTPAGYFRIYEFGSQDMVVRDLGAPFTDVVVTAKPGNGDTIQVNGGDVVTANGASGANEQAGPDSWGVSSQAVAPGNLWRDAFAFGGYDQDAGVSNSWSAPNTTPSQISLGVRFTSTNGSPVVVSTTGSWATIEARSGSEYRLQPVLLDVTLRGFNCRTVESKKYRRLVMGIAVWAAVLSVTVLPDGVGEDRSVLSGRAFDRKKSLLGRTGDWDDSNTGDDHGDPYREDYSVVLPETGMKLGSGVVLDRFQEYVTDHELNLEADYVQVRIQSTGGRLKVRHVALEATYGNRRSSVKGVS